MGPEELKIWLSNKKVEYEDDMDLSKFLSSDNSDMLIKDVTMNLMCNIRYIIAVYAISRLVIKKI